VLTIVEARGAPVGTVVTVAGVVTAEGGRLGLPPLIAIADGTGGIAVRLPDGVPSPARGTTVTVKGPIADPYGQLELRPTSAGFKVTGQGSLPAPLQIVAANLGESTEGRLATLTGTVKAAPQKGTSGDLTIELVDAAGTAFRVLADGSSQVLPGDLVKDGSYRLTGIVGQRASRKGALDGYRLYVRGRSDIAAVPNAAQGSPGASAAPAAISPISIVLALPDGKPVTIEGSVTAGVSLLDSSGRRIVVQDGTGAIEVYLPSGTAAPTVGSRLRITGTTGHAWSAPRVAATTVASTGSGAATAPATLGRAPAERDEWLLVRVSGTVLKVERLGDKWRAEVQLAGGAKVPVLGQAGAGIPSTAVLAGRKVTITGIVKRPYPTASDRRFAVLPRNGSDVSIGPAGDGAPTGTLDTTAKALGGATAATAAADITPDTDLATLLEHVGSKVRVGGLIAAVAGDGFDLDDGTALAHVVLRDDMVALLPHLRAGEAIAATGTVELLDGAPVVVVGDEGTLVRVGSLGQALPIGAQGPIETPQPDPSAGAGSMRADSAGLGSDFAPSSALALAAITAMSVLVTVLRRRLMRRQLRTVLVDRLATLRGKEGRASG
jgi:DNA/RNA endonuclease YhcR with UshA esterase domain